MEKNISKISLRNLKISYLSTWKEKVLDFTIPQSEELFSILDTWLEHIDTMYDLALYMKSLENSLLITQYDIYDEDAIVECSLHSHLTEHKWFVTHEDIIPKHTKFEIDISCLQNNKRNLLYQSIDIFFGHQRANSISKHYWKTSFDQKSFEKALLTILK